ncbi:70 kDa peptidyl-prolyl isomerase [Trifolium medium]|uniref:70 kDa peptidyl-prolyl isomerase n=1 Tax=Trifolium medium TaxID=97028 RepID=A0A392PT68_9FABA|nr:70 kDa peptidyl-prolyl isomerase [Trifolium medium]
MVGECRVVLVDIVLQPNILDQWLWRHDAGGGYSVKDVYQLLITMDPPGVDAASDLIWHKQVPLKVSVLAWRLLRNKLLAKDNLVRRNIIAHDSQMCVSGCGGLETTRHLTILSSSHIRLEECELTAHSCSLYGYVAFGLCGMSGIIEFSRQMRLQFTKC